MKVKSGTKQEFKGLAKECLSFKRITERRPAEMMLALLLKQKSCSASSSLLQLMLVLFFEAGGPDHAGLHAGLRAEEAIPTPAAVAAPKWSAAGLLQIKDGNARCPFSS